MRYDLTETQREKLAEARAREREAVERAQGAQRRLNDVLALIRDAHGIPEDAEGQILPDGSAIIVDEPNLPVEGQAESA